MSSRVKLSAKNFIWSIVSNLVTTVFNFFLKTVFIKTLGATYLGLNGLFTNIIGVLNLAELGFGAAISFSLYKPLAENDNDKLQAYIKFYKAAYRIIAITVCVMGLAITPFIPRIAKGAEDIGYLRFAFLIYLFNTVSSYLITYKSTTLSADQKDYIITNTNTIVNSVIVILQIAELFIFKNYLLYLAIASVIGLIKNISINIYVTKKYPFLKGKDDNIRLSKEEKSTIFIKIKALLYHKIGGVVIFQTDNIITSSVINVTMVGLVSNYTMLINVIKGFVGAFTSSTTASFGNLIASTNSEKCLSTFKNVNFISYWLANFTATTLFFLLSPFIKIWIGADFLVADTTVFLLCINYYITIIRQPVSAVKLAAGAYEADKPSPIIESIINLVVSILLAKKIGIAGVYMGTLLSSIVPVIWAPIVVYKAVFNASTKKYFTELILRTLLMLSVWLGLYVIFENVFDFENFVLSLIYRLAVCFVVPNAIMLAIYHKTDEFKYCVSLVKGATQKLLHK